MSVKTQPLQEAFNAGEFGKRMAGRVQFGKYQNAGATFENILPLPQGGFTSRSGSRYVIGAKSNSVRPWLMPFVFSTTQAYMIELGETAMRFFRNQGQITAADIGATVSNGAFPTDLTDWDDNSNGSGAIAHDATNLDMNLVGAGASNEAIATQDIATTTTAVEHVVAFQIVGTPATRSSSASAPARARPTTTPTSSARPATTPSSSRRARARSIWSSRTRRTRRSPSTTSACSTTPPST